MGLLVMSFPTRLVLHYLMSCSMSSLFGFAGGDSVGMCSMWLKQEGNGTMILRVQVGRQLQPRIQAISTTSNVAVAAHMETKAIIEHWFGEEVEGSDQSVDNVVMEMIGQRRREMATTAMSLNKSELLSRFMGSIEDDK
ncbi:hypothetical protein AHAS_Ahas15G0244400 [Arachis hypogaea]